MTDSISPLLTDHPVVFILVATIAMSICVPKTVVSLAAGTLFGTVGGIASLAVIAVAAASIDYVVGYWMGGRFQWQKRIESRYPRVAAVSRISRDAGVGLHLLIRFSPVPTMIISVLMGVIEARLRPYLIAALLGIAPQILWIHSAALASEVAAEADTSSARWVSLSVSVISAIVISLWIPRAATRELKKHQEVRNE